MTAGLELIIVGICIIAGVALLSAVLYHSSLMARFARFPRKPLELREQSLECPPSPVCRIPRIEDIKLVRSPKPKEIELDAEKIASLPIIEGTSPTEIAPENYIFFPRIRDAGIEIAFESDLQYRPTELSFACDTTSGCIGFESDGTLFSEIKPKTEWTDRYPDERYIMSGMWVSKKYAAVTLQSNYEWAFEAKEYNATNSTLEGEACKPNNASMTAVSPITLKEDESSIVEIESFRTPTIATSALETAIPVIHEYNSFPMLDSNGYAVSVDEDVI